MPEIIIALVVCLAATLAALAALACPASRWRRGEDDPSRETGATTPAVLLFEGRRLVDATPAAATLLAGIGGATTSRAAAIRGLARRFPALPEAAAHPARPPRRQILRAGDDRIEVEAWDGFLRLSLHIAAPEPAAPDTAPDTTPDTAGAGHRAALEDELRLLRAATEEAPQLLWRTDAAGVVTWANRAYLDLADRLSSCPDRPVRGWPPAPLFPLAEAPQAEAGRSLRRFTLRAGGTEDLCYDVTSIRREGDAMHFASDATALMRSERVQHDFVQTLTKTFAALSTGLAIFDRDRRLALFNPALVDLTSLPPAFLGSRPGVHAFFDRLREARVLPEPRDYAAWRRRVLALESGAERGTFSEAWTLPGGQTYRVTGRPHPDGAIAFLIEDMTADLALTRRFRTQIETEQSALDAMPEAVAVFTAGGTLTLINRAYDRLWSSAPPETGLDESLGDVRFGDELDRWRARCAPSPLWSELQSAQRSGLRHDRTGHVRLSDGRGLACRFVQLPGGAVMAGFAVGLPESPDMRLVPARPADAAGA